MQYQLKTIILVIFRAVTSSGTLNSDTWSHGTQLLQGDISIRLDDLPLYPMPFLHTSSDEYPHQLPSRYGAVSNSLEIVDTPYYEVGGSFPSSDVCTGSGYFPKSGSCTKFYQCEKLEDFGKFSVHQFSCPPHTIFDESLHKCQPAYHHVVKRPECFTSKVTALTNTGLQDEGVLMLKKTHTTIRPSVKRLKRFAVETVLQGLKSPESLAKVASTFTGSLNQLNEDTHRFRNTKYYLQSVINKLTGMNGRIEDAQLISLESDAERKIKTTIMQNLILLETVNRQISAGTIRDLMDRDILEKHISEAVNQGLIIQRGDNRPQFTEIRVTIGDLQKFVSQEIMKSKSNIKMGFESAANIVNESRFQPLITKMLDLAATITRRLDHIENLPDAAKTEHFVGHGGYISYLKKNTLRDTLDDIINTNLAIPKNASDTSAVLALDLLFLGLEIHASMLSSIVSSYIFVVRVTLEERRLQEFNRNLAHAKSAIEMLQADLVSDRSGFFEKVNTSLNRVQQLPFFSRMNNLNSFVSEKRATLTHLESEIKKIIMDNQVLRDPGNIIGLNFEVSSVSLPMGPWKARKQVSYAVQYISKSGVSRLGEWSSPYTILNKTNPFIQLPAANSGEIRIIYRRFNQEMPESVAILYDHALTEFRDTGRDILNSISSLNKAVAFTELTTLLNAGAVVNISFENKMTPLHYAAKHGNVRAMEMLVNKGSDIHAKSADNMEALHLAALYGTEEGVEYLISKGANVSAQTKSLGLSALHIAVANGQANTVRALLRKGANVNIKDNQGLTPLHVSVVGNVNTMDVLLQNDDLDVNSKDKDGLTPLHYATRSKDEIFTEKLIKQRNLNVRAQGRNSLLTPLHFAAMRGNVRVMMRLIKQGAQISARDKEGSTPLHYAAFYGNRDAVLALVQPDPLLSLANITNKEGKIPLDLALENEMRSCVEVLQMDLNSLIEIYARELNPFLPDETPSNCVTETVNQMAKGMEETCIHVDNVNSYVDLVMSMIPLQRYYKDDEKLSEDFRNFDNDLTIAQDHAKIWKYGDSIIKRIGQTYRLAKYFEQQFKKKFQICQERVKNIMQNGRAMNLYRTASENIKKLEIQNEKIQTLMKAIEQESILQYFRNESQNIENELNKNRDILKNSGLPEILKEIVAFLEFVARDTLTIEKVANATLHKTEIFKQYLESDNSTFARHAHIFYLNLDTVQNQTKVNSEKLATLPRKIADLQEEIKRGKTMKAKISGNIWKSQVELLEIRRELKAKIHSNNVRWWIGLFLTPFIVGIPLLYVASEDHKYYIIELQETLRRDEEEKRILTATLEKRTLELQDLENQLAENQNMSDSAKVFSRHLITLKADLDQLMSGLDELLEAIGKAIKGVDVIKSVFDNVTLKLRSMIIMAEEVKTDIEREKVITLIYNDLSDLECNWKGAHDTILDLDECTRNIILSKQTVV